MTAQGHDQRCRYRADTGLGMYAAAPDGIGVAALPCYLADADDGLVRVGEPVPALSVDVWLLTHPDLRRSARIRALLDFVAEALRRLSKRRRDRLAGSAGAS